MSLSRVSSYATRFILQLGLQLCPRFPAVVAQAAGTQALNLWSLGHLYPRHVLLPWLRPCQLPPG